VRGYCATRRIDIARTRLCNITVITASIVAHMSYIWLVAWARQHRHSGHPELYHVSYTALFLFTGLLQLFPPSWAHRSGASMLRQHRGMRVNVRSRRSRAVCRSTHQLSYLYVLATKVQHSLNPVPPLLGFIQESSCIRWDGYCFSQFGRHPTI